MYQTLLAKIRAKMHEYIVHYYYYKINGWLYLIAWDRIIDNKRRTICITKDNDIRENWSISYLTLMHNLNMQFYAISGLDILNHRWDRRLHARIIILSYQGEHGYTRIYTIMIKGKIKLIITN